MNARRIRIDVPDGSSWPTLAESRELEWRLRYGELRREDVLNAAAYCAAFRELVGASEKRRRVIASVLKRADKS